MRPLVLIAEDEPYIVESLTFLIERAGLDVAVAKDGAAALQAVNNLRPAVVILDIMLPEENGMEVLRFVKSNPDLRDIPVLVLTARGQENDRQTALALGADAFVTKPFSNREVVERTLALAGVAGAGDGGRGAEMTRRRVVELAFLLPWVGRLPADAAGRHHLADVVARGRLPALHRLYLRLLARADRRRRQSWRGGSNGPPTRARETSPPARARSAEAAPC